MWNIGCSMAPCFVRSCVGTGPWGRARSTVQGRLAHCDRALPRKREQAPPRLGARLPPLLSTKGPAGSLCVTPTLPWQVTQYGSRDWVLEQDHPVQTLLCSLLRGTLVKSAKPRASPSLPVKWGDGVRPHLMGSLWGRTSSPVIGAQQSLAHGAGAGEMLVMSNCWDARSL